jgi:hypothetical protein
MIQVLRRIMPQGLVRIAPENTHRARQTGGGAEPSLYTVNFLPGNFLPGNSRPGDLWPGDFWPRRGMVSLGGIRADWCRRRTGGKRSVSRNITRKSVSVYDHTL